MGNFMPSVISITRDRIMYFNSPVIYKLQLGTLKQFLRFYTSVISTCTLTFLSLGKYTLPIPISEALTHILHQVRYILGVFYFPVKF